MQKITAYANLGGKSDQLLTEEECARKEEMRQELDPFLNLGETELQRRVEMAVHRTFLEMSAQPIPGLSIAQLSTTRLR